MSMLESISVQSLKAAKALVSHLQETSTSENSKSGSKPNPLHDADDDGAASLAETPITLQISSKTHMADSSRLRPIRIPLPHPLVSVHNSHVSVCLIVADPQRQYKDIVACPDFSDALRPRIGRVIGFSKLKAKFSQYEAQRSLYASFDVFLADDRIVNRLPKVLGKTFYKSTTKRPIPIVISPRDTEAKKQRQAARKAGKKGNDLVEAARALPATRIASEIEKALGSALFHLAPSVNSVVKVGFANWSPEHLAENVQAVVKAVTEKHMARQWNGIRALYLKGPKTTALPVWMTEQLWVDGETAVMAPGQEASSDGGTEMTDGKLATREKANTKKKRKALHSEDSREQPGIGQMLDSVNQSVRKKSKTSHGKRDREKALLTSLTASRKNKLKKEKAVARKSMD